jgi:tRNA/rRNA methyltransferase
MSGLRVVLVSPRNPLTIGAAARAISNFGFSDLALVNPYEVSFRDAVSAVGAGAVMQAAQVFPTVAEAVAGCSLVVGTTAGAHRELAVPLRRLETAAPLLREHTGSGVAILFGSEKYGLSNDDISHCQWLLRIPSRPEHGSMNLGQAVAVCLYELIRSDSPPTEYPEPPPPPAASSEQTEALLSRMEEVLQIAGYYDHTATGGSERRLRQLLHRMNPTKHDAAVWLGIFRQILWKLRQHS